MALIAPDDANIVYSPYNWDVTSVRALSVNGGAYFRFRVAGGATTITLNFDVAGLPAPLPRLLIRVDGALTSAFAEAAVASVVGTVIPSTNTWPDHDVEVYIDATTQIAPRWTTPTSVVKFTGITVTGGAGAMPTVPITKRGLRLLVYGDSIVEGVRTRKGSGTDDVAWTSSWMGWAAQLGYNLGAEVGVVGFGGQGVSVAGSGSVPAWPSSYNLVAAGIARAFTPAPDAILCMFGENDGAANIVAAYVATLTALVAATPAATKILCFRTLGGNQAANVQAAVAAMNATTARVSYVDTTGWFDNTHSFDATHPYGYEDIDRISPLAAAAVRAVLSSGSGSGGGSNLFTEVGGGVFPGVSF